MDVYSLSLLVDAMTSRPIRLMLLVILLALALSNPSHASQVVAVSRILQSHTASSDSSQPPFQSSVSSSSSHPSGAYSRVTTDLAGGSFTGYANARGTDYSGGYDGFMSERFTISVPGATANTLTRVYLRTHFDAQAIQNSYITVTTHVAT